MTNTPNSNKADLRILSRIHKDLGIKTPDEVYEMRKKPTKPVNKLKVFIAVIRSVARMRIDARKWTEHQKTRDQLKAAWDEQKRKNKLKAVLAASSSSGASAPAPHNPAPAYDFDS
ncbi:hypothetical protein F5Y16DRAFT_96696 [Xylariaceae sp. FL0255]|nr:hypothetical protein F5Y16DRAFT_96696 [Xylariaceae sp. FL0255]